LLRLRPLPAPLVGLRQVVREEGEAEKSRRVTRLAVGLEAEEELKTTTQLEAVREAEEDYYHSPTRPVPRLEAVREEERAGQAVRFARRQPMIALDPAREEVRQCRRLREAQPTLEAEPALVTARMEER
jgi:hypothetical protein